MYHYIAYPLDVAKTNRILNTSFNKECSENLGREIVTMYERGQFRNGDYRGLIPLAGMTLVGGGAFSWMKAEFRETEPLYMRAIPLLLCTTLAQPLNTLMTHRQVINSTTFAEPSYKQIMGNWGKNIPKLFSLGMSAALLRNTCLMMALLPRQLGNEWVPLDAGFAFGALLVSHPFEVARVLIVC